MKTSDLRLSNTSSLPIEAVTSTLAVLGKKGSGKTYLSKKLAEQMLHSGFQVVILDIVGVWWGLKSSADGRSAGFAIPILGGEHGDLALASTAGEVTARSIVEGGFSCIVDMKLFGKAEAHRFAGPFLETLYKLNRNAMHLMVDEADFYAPQSSRYGGPETITLGAMDTLVRRGRARGIGVSMLTQRPQVLNKDVLTSTDILFTLRLNHNLDLKPVRNWVNVKADETQAKTMLADLPGMATGDYYVWAPELDIFRKDRADACETFDSSATPKPGKARVTPKVLAEIDLKALGEQIQATVEEQKANDPAALKRRIAELERQAAKPVEIVADSVLRREIQDLQAMRAQMQAYAQKVCEDAALSLRSLDQQLRDLAESAASSARYFDKRPTEAPPEATLSDVMKKVITPPTLAPTLGQAKSVAKPEAVAGLNEPKQRILNAIATFEDAGVPPRLQAIAAYCGTTARARGFEENIRQLRTDGFLETRDGVLKMQGPYGTAEAMQGDGALRKVLSGPAYAMLQVVREHPGITAEVLATASNTTVRARGFEENLRRLRSDELLIGSKDSLRVAEWLRG